MPIKLNVTAGCGRKSELKVIPIFEFNKVKIA